MTVARASTGLERTTRVGSTALAVATLRDLGMPWAEIEAILDAHDPRLVRRYLQLHSERLEERLGEQRSLLLSVEPILAAGSPYRCGTDGYPGACEFEAEVDA